MIEKFIASLSKRGKIILVVTLIIVVIALFDSLLIGPTISRMAAIDGDIVKEQNIIKQNLHFLEYKDRILKESQDVQSYITRNLPAEEEMIAAFLKKMEILAGKGNVTLIKVTPSPGTQEKDYLKYQVDLECSGKIADIITFMHLIDTSEELVKVIKFNLASKKADTDEIKAMMSVIKIIVGTDPRPIVKPLTDDKAVKDNATDSKTGQ